VAAQISSGRRILAQTRVMLVLRLVARAAVPWLSGRASASHAEGRWFDPSRDHTQSSQVIPEGEGPVIPEGEGPVKANGCVVLVRSASFLVLAGRVEVGVGVKARAEPDRARP
jgi:hypothetical protein